MTERRRWCFLPRKGVVSGEQSTGRPVRIPFPGVSLKGKGTGYWIISVYPVRCLLLDLLRLPWPALATLSLLDLICFMGEHSGQSYHLACWHSHRDLLISICAACHWQNNKGDSGKLPKWYIISQSKTKRGNSNKESVNLTINERRISTKYFKLNAVAAKLSITLHSFINFAFICRMVSVPFFGAIMEHQPGRRTTGRRKKKKKKTLPNRIAIYILRKICWFRSHVFLNFPNPEDATQDE